MKHSILIAALLCLLMGALARAETYQLVTEEWAPYNYRENEHITGMATEVVRAIMALTGDDFEIRMRPSMRASRVLQTQPRTIMYSMFRTPERESLFKWVGPIAEESIYPYQLAAAAQPIHTLEQLLHTPRITTRHAGLVPTMLASMGFDNLDTSATESEQLYRMLLAGRTEVIIGDTDAGVAYYSRQLVSPRALSGGCPSSCTAPRCISPSAATATMRWSRPGPLPWPGCAARGSWRASSAATNGATISDRLKRPGRWPCRHR